MEGPARRPQDPKVPPQGIGGGSYWHQVFRLSIQRREGHRCPGPSNCPCASWGGGRFQSRSWRSSKAFRSALLGPQHHPAPSRAPQSHCPHPFTYITSSSQGDQKVLHFQRELVLVKTLPTSPPHTLSFAFRFTEIPGPHQLCSQEQKHNKHLFQSPTA